MLLKVFLFTALFLGPAQLVVSSKILGVFWTPSKSHHILGSSLLQALARKGHDVTVLTPFIDDVKLPRYKQVELDGIRGTLDNMMSKNASFLDKAVQTYNFALETTSKFFENKAIQELLTKKDQFDVIILLNFINDATLGLCHELKAPTIIFFPGGTNFLMNQYVANPDLYSYESESFIERLKFVTIQTVRTLVIKYVLETKTQKILRHYLPNSPSISDLKQNVSLVLVNSHYSIEPPRPFVPNMVQIGGFYAQAVQPLPEEFQEFLDNALEGAILFSFGSNMKIKNVDKPILEVFLKGLEKLAPMKVIFKSEIDLPYVPKNFMVKKWLPQNDILAHPNIRAFVSHGGLGGITEAVYHGVPLVGIPLFAEQDRNVDVAVAEGFAVGLTYEEITQNKFDKALGEVLKNPKYFQNAKKRSNLLRKQPMDPLEKAVWWVEHIIEYKGGEHLRNKAMDLRWYQMYMFDILFFFIFVISLLLLIPFYFIKFVLRISRKRIMKKKSKKE